MSPLVRQLDRGSEMAHRMFIKNIFNQNDVQGNQLNMAVFFWFFVKPCTVYATVRVYTGPVTFFKVPNKTRPCLIGHPVFVNKKFK